MTATAARPAGTVRIGRLAGADVLVSRSWFVIAALIAVLTAPRAEAVAPGLGNWKYLAGLAFAVVLYLSVLLHEASHALMARRFGFPVSSITLHFLGGMTAVEGEARRPREEFWIAVVGPVASLLVGGAGLLGTSMVDGGLVRMVCGGVAVSNLIIGILNLVPGLPLDGGRVLKSVVWQISGNPHRGSLIAGWCGRLLAVAVFAWPFLGQWLTEAVPSVLDYAMAVIIAGFLWSGATAAISSARLRERLPSLVARALVRETISVTEGTPLAEATRQADLAGARSILTVNMAGQVIGIVSADSVEAVPAGRRPWVPVGSVARTIEPTAVLPASIAGEELILALSRHPAREYLLVEADGTHLGVLATDDVDDAFGKPRH
ncbi:MAG: M50 family metallopeptidase [Nocardioides sp.]